MKFMRNQNIFSKHLILNVFRKLILEKCCFPFSVTSNRDFEKFSKIVSQKVLVKSQTGKVFARSISGTTQNVSVFGVILVRIFLH